MKKLHKLLVIFNLLLITISFNTPFFKNDTIEIRNHQYWIANGTTTTRMIKNLAIMIRFQNSDSNVIHHIDDDQSISNVYKIYNSDKLFEMNSVNGMIQVPSFKKYFERESYGNLSITTEIFPKVDGKVVAYQDIYPIGYYLKYNTENQIGYKDKNEAIQREIELVNRAIEYTSNQIKDFGITADDIDSNHDGRVDAISFLIEGQKNLPSTISWGDILWSHKMDSSGIEKTILGKNITAYNLLYADDYTESASLFSLNRGTYGTIIHEFGHTLGYMDLYRYGEPTSKPVGFYDIMGNAIGSNPQSFLTYFVSEYRADTNWHSPIPEIQNTTNNITLYQPKFIDKNEKRAIKIKIDSHADEYFIVEYHSKLNTYESYSADKSGIIIYRINEKNKYLGNSDGSNQGKNEHVYVFRPGETGLGEGKGNLSQATLNIDRPTFGKNIHTSSNQFDPETIFFSDGSNSGIQIQVVSETTDSVTFDVIFPKLEVEGNGSANSPYLIDDVDTFLQLMRLNTKNKYYKINDHLDFRDIKDYPIINFEGNLDGNYKTISNIVTNGAGVFQNIGIYENPTKIENLFLENITVTSKNENYLGGFANVAENITLNNIHMKSGTVKKEGVSINDIVSTGGLIGNASNQTMIENCSTNVNVSATKNVGGLIGINLNAYIKNSFAIGTVNGNENVGGIIGLQAISEKQYHIPYHVYYKDNANQTMNGVGGYAKGVHDLSVLDSSSLSKGIFRIWLSPQVQVQSKMELPLIIESSKNLNYHIIIQDPMILKYENNQIIPLKSGDTTLNVDIAVGSHTMRLSTNVMVRPIENMSEDELLNLFDLVKKDNYIMGFTLGTDIKDLQKTFSSAKVSIKSIQNSYGTEIKEGIIATGMKLILNYNQTEYHYIVVIKGDTNGDGRVFATDYVKVKNHIMGKTKLQGAYLLAADVNHDGKVYATDYVVIKNHIMGKSVIHQKP